MNLEKESKNIILPELEQIPISSIEPGIEKSGGTIDRSDFYAFTLNQDSYVNITLDALDDINRNPYVEFSDFSSYNQGKTSKEISEDNGLFSEDNIDYYENQEGRIDYSYQPQNTARNLNDWYCFYIIDESNVEYYENQKAITNAKVNITYTNSNNSIEPGKSCTVTLTWKDVWDEKIDEEISENNGLFSEENLDYYENQKAWTIEVLPVNKTVESYELTPRQKSLIQEYSKLAILLELSEPQAEIIRESIEYESKNVKFKEFMYVNQTVQSYKLKPRQKSLIEQYSKLENLPELSESQADRMGEIIEMAESDNLLSSCLEKIEDKILKKLGLFSEEKLDYCEDKKTRIKEFFPVNQTVESYELTPRQKSLIQEYSKLANLPELSEFQADRMGEIIEMAESDNLLSSLIEKIDDEISEKLGLFSENNIDYYENQKARIKEFLPVNKTVHSYELTPRQKNLIQEYAKLANLPELSESQADRMGEIIEMAESDNLLSSLIEKIDDKISEKLGLFSKENLDYYENQKARIKEFLVC